MTEKKAEMLNREKKSPRPLGEGGGRPGVVLIVGTAGTRGIAKIPASGALLKHKKRRRALVKKKGPCRG